MNENFPANKDHDIQGPSAPEAQPEQPAQVIIQPRNEKAWVTYAIIGVTVFIYLLQMLSQYLFRGDYPAAVGMKINEYIMAGQVWRLFTPVLLHGSILHIGFNMLFLYRIGPGLEREYGSGRFFALYLATAFTGNVLSFIFTRSPSLGASTAIFGLVTAQAVLIYRNQRLFHNPRGALNNIIMTIVINLALGMSPGIDNFGHLGGLLGGLAISWFAGPLLALRQELDGYHIYDKQPSQRFAIVVCAAVLIFALLAAGKMFLV